MKHEDVEWLRDIAMVVLAVSVLVWLFCVLLPAHASGESWDKSVDAVTAWMSGAAHGALVGLSLWRIFGRENR